MLEVKDKKDTRTASLNPLVYILLCLIVEGAWKTVGVAFPQIFEMTGVGSK